jgi:long-chain acyl-CoA synthetase
MEVTAAAGPERLGREQPDIAQTVAGQTICSLFQDRVGRLEDRPALMTKQDRSWASLIWRRYGERVRAAAFGLMHLGLEPGQAVAILMGRGEE